MNLSTRPPLPRNHQEWIKLCEDNGIIFTEKPEPVATDEDRKRWKEELEIVRERNQCELPRSICN